MYISLSRIFPVVYFKDLPSDVYLFSILMLSQQVTFHVYEHLSLLEVLLLMSKSDIIRATRAFLSLNFVFFIFFLLPIYSFICNIFRQVDLSFLSSFTE